MDFARGVLLTHANVVAVVAGVEHYFTGKFGPGDIWGLNRARFFSLARLPGWLPGGRVLGLPSAGAHLRDGCTGQHCTRARGSFKPLAQGPTVMQLKTRLKPLKPKPQHARALTAMPCQKVHTSPVKQWGGFDKLQKVCRVKANIQASTRCGRAWQCV